KLKYVNKVIKDGKTYFYFRRAGSPRTPLPGLPGSVEFMEAYAVALNDTPEPKLNLGANRTVPGTVNAVIAGLYRDPTFTKNVEITRKTDRNLLEQIRTAHGSKRVALMEKRHIMALLAEKEGKPAAQRNRLRVIRMMLDYAMQEKLR